MMTLKVGFKDLSPILDASTSIEFINDLEEDGKYYFIIKYGAGFYNLIFIDDDRDKNVEEVELANIDFEICGNNPFGPSDYVYLTSSLLGDINITPNFQPTVTIADTSETFSLNTMQDHDKHTLSFSGQNIPDSYNNKLATVSLKINDNFITWTGTIRTIGKY